MKLDILIPVGEKGGVENVINMTAPYLQDMGVEVRVVQMIWEGVEWVLKGIPFYALIKGLDGHTLLELIETYTGFLQENGVPDVILATTWPSMCDVARRTVDLFPETDTKIISWLHAPVKRYMDAGYGGYDYLGMADAHLAISTEIYKDLKNHFSQQIVEIIYNPVDFTKCVMDKGRQTDEQDALDIKQRQCNKLFYVGRVSEEKRIDVILQGLAGAGEQWELFIIGDDDTRYGTRMKEFAKTLKVLERVHFIGWQKNPWALSVKPDVVVLASEYEGFPLAAIEAQANGIPVISTPVSGITDLIESGVNGYLFPFGDWNALADTLDKLSRNDLQIMQSDKCREKVLCFEKNRAVEDFYKKVRGIVTELEKNRSLENHRIYQTIAQLQYSVNTIIYACRTQNYDKVVRNFTAMTNLLMQVLNELFENIAYYNQEMEIVNPESVSAALEDILTAQDNRDYILVADLLEIKLIPFLQSVQEVIRTYDAGGTDPAVWENNVKALKECNQPLLHKLMDYHKQYEQENANGTWKGKHHLEDTNSGAFTMAGEDEKGVYYYHSNLDPLAEAVTFARYYYDIACDHYILWGLGLGYHARELLMLDDGIRLKIFESDMDVIYHCMMTTDLSVQLLAGSISLEYDADFSRVIQALDENTKAFIIHHPSLRHIKDSRIRKQMEMFFISDSGKRNSEISLKKPFL